MAANRTKKEPHPHGWELLADDNYQIQFMEERLISVAFSHAASFKMIRFMVGGMGNRFAKVQKSDGQASELSGGDYTTKIGPPFTIIKSICFTVAVAVLGLTTIARA